MLEFCDNLDDEENHVRIEEVIGKLIQQYPKLVHHKRQCEELLAKQKNLYHGNCFTTLLQNDILNTKLNCKSISLFLFSFQTSHFFVETANEHKAMQARCAIKIRSR